MGCSDPDLPPAVGEGRGTVACLGDEATLLVEPGASLEQLSVTLLELTLGIVRLQEPCDVVIDRVEPGGPLATHAMISTNSKDLVLREGGGGEDDHRPPVVGDDEHFLRLHDLRAVGTDRAGLVEVTFGGLANCLDGLEHGSADELTRGSRLAPAVLPLTEDDVEERGLVESLDGPRIRDEPRSVDDEDRTAIVGAVEPGTALHEGDDDLLVVGTCVVGPTLPVATAANRCRVLGEMLGRERMRSVARDESVEASEPLHRAIGMTGLPLVSQPVLDVGVAEEGRLGEAGEDEGLAQFVHRFVEQLSHDLSPILLGSLWFLGRWRLGGVSPSRDDAKGIAKFRIEEMSILSEAELPTWLKKMDFMSCLGIDSWYTFFI